MHSRTLKFLVAFPFLAQALVFSSLAEARLRNMKRDPKGSKGVCLVNVIQHKVQADDLLKAYGITTVDGGILKQREIEVEAPPESLALEPSKNSKGEKVKESKDNSKESKEKDKNSQVVLKPVTERNQKLQSVIKKESEKKSESKEAKKSEGKELDKVSDADKSDSTPQEPPKPKMIKQIVNYMEIPNPPRAFEQERMNLAKALAQITVLNGGHFQPFKKTVFDFSDRKRFSEELGNTGAGGNYRITMNRCRPEGDKCEPNNVAHLIHELGHQLGNSTYKLNQTHYQAYRRLVGGDCHPTDRSDDNFNEQFAEVFSAYVTHPELLLEDPICQRAYAFFAVDVFKHNGVLSSCNKDSMDALDKQWASAVQSREEEIASIPAMTTDGSQSGSKRSNKSASQDTRTIVRFKVVQAPPRPKFEDELPVRKPVAMAEEISTRNQTRKELEKKAKKGVQVTEAEVEAATKAKLEAARKSKEANAKAAAEELKKPMSQADQEALVASVAKILKSKPFAGEKTAKSSKNKSSQKSSNIKSDKKSNSSSKSKAFNKSKSKSKARG